MNSVSYLVISVALLFSHASAAPLPTAGAMREVLAISESTAFTARFGSLLDGLEANQVSAFRAALAETINQGGWPPSHAAKAIEWTDQSWARLDPKGLLEAAAARLHPYSTDAQLVALDHLLRKDRELAIALYLATPANENFGFHCQFYERLAALDPPRAARLFLESPDVDRTFANPLEAAFRHWAKQDLKVAWAAANQIDRKNWRDSAREAVLKEADRTGQRQSLTPEEKPAARPVPIPAPTPEPEDDGALEQLLTDGYAAYSEKSSDPQGKLIERLFARFPERSLEWLHQMEPNDAYASNRYRDLAAAWPKNQLPADTVRMLECKSLRDREFGIYLTWYWMKADPETAVPLLLSRYPALAPRLCRALPFYELTYPKKQTPEQVRVLLDKITDLTARDLALREFSLYQIDGMEPAEALAALVALPHEDDRLRAAENFARSSVRNHPTRRIVQLIAELDAGHAAFRDHLLALLPAEILDTNDADRNAIPEILSAIRDPEWVIKSCGMAAYNHIPVVLNERLIAVLAKLPPGGLRDGRINEWISSLPPADGVALLGKSRDPFVCRSLLLRIPWRQLSADQFASCLAALELLPAAWRDEATDGRWIAAQALRDPAGGWQDFARYYEAHPGFNDSWSFWEERMKSDPRGLAEDLAKTRPGSLLRRFLPKALVAAHDGDFTAAFGKFRLIPDSETFATTEFFKLWTANDPAAAAPHSLLIGPDQVRLASLGNAVKAWAEKDAMAAGSWLKRLPESPERTTAATRWLAQVRNDPNILADEIKKLLPPPPARPVLSKEMESMLDEVGDDDFAMGREGEQKQQARATFLRHRSTFRALADLDIDAAAKSVRELPDGELKTAAWLGLLECATATGKDELAAELTAKLLAAGAEWKLEIDRLVVSHAPLHHLAKVIACADAITNPAERNWAAISIVKRWSAREHRAEITRWIRVDPDPIRREELARFYLREVLDRATPEPATAPDFEHPVCQAIIAEARAQLLAEMLDKRPSDPELIKRAALDEATVRLLATWPEPPATDRN